MEETQATAPAEQATEKTEPVRDAEAVLRKNQEILAEKKRLEKELEELKQFKSNYEAEKAKAEEERLSKRGEYEKLLEQKQKAFEERIAAEAAEREKVQSALKSERWENFLAENGVLASRLKTVKELLAIEQRTELIPDADGRLSLRLKDGVGDPGELQAAIARFTSDEGNTWLKAGTLAPGSGASGSQGGGGQTGKVISRDQWEKMSPAESVAFFQNGGTLADA